MNSYEVSPNTFFAGRIPYTLDYAWYWALQGYAFYASDADQNDVVTGQTSFANTTPTFLLLNPNASARVCIPLFFTLNQTGSVAGGDVQIVTEIDEANRYSTGGTSETVLSSRPRSGRKNECLLYTGATALAGYGVRVDGITTGPDVSPAEGALQQYLWTPTSGIDILDPGSTMLCYTYAGTTGPTWFWTWKWLEIPVRELGI